MSRGEPQFAVQSEHFISCFPAKDATICTRSLERTVLTGGPSKRYISNRTRKVSIANGQARRKQV